MHPFGREEASSLEKLFVFFTQCLLRGEWALAQACVPQLREWQGGGAGRVQEILQAIVACPYQLRWDTIGSPHRLAWLWLQVLEKWFQEQIPVFVKSELEFMLLLEELQTEASENVLKEFYQTFLHSHSPNITKEKKREPRSAQLSAEAVSCLWDVLSEKPGLAQALMGYLLAHDCDSDSLHKLFIDFLQEVVCGLRSSAGGHAVEQVYSGLSVLHCNPEQPAGELRQLCEALFESSWGEAAPLREERVMSCLLRPHDHALVSLYSSVATERTKEKLLEHKPHEQVSAELSEAEKVILALFSHCDRTSAWKTIYFDCLSSGKHFLEQVLELHCDFVLKEFGDGLSTQVKILEWCSENNRNSIPSTDLLRHLHSVDCHSALYILHSLTTLPALDEERVIQLLQGLPATHSNGPAGLAEASTLVRRRNVVLFQGFCAMKYAVYALCVNAHKHSACKDCLGSLAEEQPESREEPGKEQCSSPGYPKLFKKYMDKCHQHLQALPVAFRLELLENIYSLLFTSHSDFSSEKAEESALEEDDEGVEEGEAGRNSEVRSLNSSLEHSNYPETGQQGEGESSQPQRSTHLKDAASQTFSHLHLKHFANGASGFMADEAALEAFLKLLKEHLDGIDRDVLREGERTPDTEKELAECLNCSISTDAFNTRLQRLSKYISETQWRFQVVTSNKTAEGQISATKKLHPVTLRRSSFKKRRRAARSRADGSASAFPGQCDLELRPLSVERNLLIPMMLSPPESLLISCILRGNFMEARQGSSRNEFSVCIVCRQSLVPKKPVEWLTRCSVFHTPAGQKVDSAVQPPEGIRGFPAVLQQISKILNHTPGGRGGARPEVNEEKLQSHFSCSVLEVLLTCYPALTEERMATQLSISHRLEHTLHTISTAIDCTELRGGSLFASLVEQSSLKSQEREVHPVRSQMKALLRTMDQHIQTQGSSGRARPDYIRSGFDYINTLAAVLVRSLNPELDPVSEVKLGNSLLVLQQTPTQLLSHLLFERQVSPDRISSLLHKEELNLSIQQVIVSCSCESLPLWDTRKQGQNPSLLDSVGWFVQQYAEQYLPNLETAFPTSTESREDVTAAVSPPVSPGSSTQFILTPSALGFLKSRSSLLATLACLTASKGVKTAKTGLSSWRDFRGKRETPLDLEQITKECDHLLQEFPVLERFLRAMSEPLEGSPEEPAGVVGALCGQPCSGLVLSGVHCSSTLGIAAGAFQQALVTGALSRALSILRQYGQEGHGLSHMQDILLSCAAVEEVDGMKHLFLVKDADLRARLVLHCLEKWPLGACLEILMYCVSDSETAEELKENLLLKKQELQIYQQILDLSSPSSWSDWQEVRRDSREDPESVLDVILRAKEFGLCERWVELHPVSPECRMRLQREHLLHLLETGDSEDAFQLLQSLSDPELCLLISEQALDQRPGLTACHFLANYLTSHFHKSVAPTRQHEIQAMRIGSELLLSLPEPARQDYFQLSSSPLLMLEQLLMNMKVDWAAAAVLSLQQLLLGQEAGFTAEDINELLSRYARKALDFPYAPRERTRADSVISLQDLLIQTPGQETFPPLLSTETTPSSTAGSSPLHTPKAPPERAPCRQKLEFTPPERPPGKKNWIPDQQQDVCMVCRKERFTMFNRRHHCRRCGRLVCNTCSTRKMVVQGCREDPVRVCDQCYSFYNQDPGSGCLDFSVILQLPEVPERLRKLSLNEAENEIERSEFYYEQAPSSSLCIAILNLHGNSIVCGQQLIEHCRQLSRGLTNPEVDPRLLTDIMKQLLFSAKLMFVKAGRSQDLALCDSYISKVDVLKILVSANYKYVPSLDQILQPAAVSRLRNQLLEAEYYQLAVEVSTKSGLDPGGVWHAWGMACLKAGNLTAAREKFSRCLKPPFDPNQQNHGPQLLQDIIQHLESTVKLSFSLVSTFYTICYTGWLGHGLHSHVPEAQSHGSFKTQLEKHSEINQLLGTG
ncbi:Zinc finger FYVE domain-containing protein 26 [Acipenser ruthenus]|uniref:Zinc finger FYVE domain-containing protein 26 n=1 Tax=Acipenser ruthenus TaxID=7906 RepID=A0A662YN66_ACIRT|nr:Zinc finger FYVE domain-containing protein 26 [Acipenser ruthenus]